MNHCCEEMTGQIKCNCDEHTSAFDCPDCLVSYNEKFNEYGLVIHDGGSATLDIQFCPWCGSLLPASRRDEWFEKIEALGLNPYDEKIPEEFKSGAWWRATLQASSKKKSVICRRATPDVCP